MGSPNCWGYTAGRLRKTLCSTAGICSVLCALQSAAAEIAVTICGQQVDGHAVLVADLDCSGAGTGSGSFAVVLNGGSLDLRGFKITAADHGVRCNHGKCRINSEPAGGVIEGTAPCDPGSLICAGLYVANGTTPIANRPIARVDGITIRGFERGIYRPVALKMRDTTIAENALDGVLLIPDTYQKARVSIDSSTIVDNGTIGLHIFNGTGAIVRRSLISGNGMQGIRANAPLTLVETTVSGNLDTGVEAATLRLARDSSITGNGRHGLEAARMNLRSTSVTANGTGVTCGASETCADLAASEQPSLDSTSVCNTSYVLLSGFPGTNWGACSAD